MEFPEFHLNEPFILTPYKIVVSNFLLCYIEEKNRIETCGESNSMNILSHCHFGFKIMMSLDCPYSQLLHQIETYVEPSLSGNQYGISTALLLKFHENLTSLRNGDVNELVDFTQKLSGTVHRKTLQNRSLTDISTSKDIFKINRHSIAGFYIRKLMIHFERLSYSDVTFLHHQLLLYLEGKDDKTFFQKELMNKNNDSKIATRSFTITTDSHEKSEKRNEKLEKINIERLRQKVSHSSSLDPIAKAHFKNVVEIVQKLKNEEKQTEFNLSPFLSNNKSAEKTEPNSIDFDFDASAMNISTESDPRNQSCLNSTTSLTTTPSDSYYRKYATQQFLTKQVHKLLVNEKSALSPPEISSFINFYFEQNNSFYYNRFIKLNYFANLTMAKEIALAGIKESSGRDGSVPITAANSAFSSLNNGGKKSKDMFKAINFHGFVLVLIYIS